MKRIIALLLSIVMLFTGCAQVQPSPASTTPDESSPTTPNTAEPTVLESVEPPYDSLDDEQFLAHVEDLVYRDTVEAINSDEYFVENVSAVYISKEYLEEVAFNSQTNIYFGYTLTEIDELFQGTRYIFTLSESGTTTVQELQEIEDTSAETILKNVAIGTGVILICVTVSSISAGTGTPTAVSLFFAASATKAEIFAFSSAAFGSISAGIVRGIQTGDFDEAIEAAALAGSDGFKWGAFYGVIATGVSYAKALHALKGVPLSGLTPYQAAAIQVESKYPLDVIKQFSDMKQYEICKKAGLTAKMVNGQTALIRGIDLNYLDDLGRTNLERMQQGLAALDPSTGQSYQLHHVGQKVDSTLAILTEAEHMQGGNNKIWHDVSKTTEVHNAGNNWDAQRQAFWKAVAQILGGV